MSKSKFKYGCAINGVVTVYVYPRYPNGISGICPHMAVADNSKCLAHGNKKCKHKSKLNNKR